MRWWNEPITITWGGLLAVVALFFLHSWLGGWYWLLVAPAFVGVYLWDRWHG